MEKSKLSPQLRNQLFIFVRAALNVSSLTFELNNCEFEELLRIVEKQSLQQLIYQGMKKYDVPLEVLREFDAARLNSTRQYIIQLNSFKDICSSLDNANIDYIPLKGSVLRDYYPIPEMRSCLDIDILVHKEDLEKAIEVLESSTNFKAIKRNYHDVSMVTSNVHLELHFNIKENMENIDKLLEKVWDYAVLVDCNKFKLTPEFQIFHVVAHMSYHMVHGGLGIRPFLDLWLLRNNTKYNDVNIRSMLRECSILKFYEKCCELVDSWMAGTPVPDDLISLEEYVLNGGVFGSKETALASRLRKHRGFSYVFHRIFMDRHLLETEYPELINKPFLFPFYQIKRWTRLIKKGKRKQVKSEVKSVNNLNLEIIDSFDKLLNSLGL